MSTPDEVQAADLGNKHAGMTLVYYPTKGKKQRRARILGVNHASTYAAVTVQTAQGRGVVVLRLDEPVAVEP